MGVAEAADVLGVAEGTVKSRCARGRAALAELLGLDPRTGRLDAGDDRSDRSGSNGNRPGPPDV
jgi:RNA polymerase sigma-70 factor (ECF subfamily)